MEMEEATFRELLEQQNRYIFVKTAYAAYWSEQFKTKPFLQTLRRYLQQ